MSTSVEKCQVLVLTQGYPSESDRYNLAYVHSRNIQYLEFGIQPIVLNFGTRASYIWEGIPVYSEADLKQRGQHWPLLISHAPNLRNHLRFLLTQKSLYQHCLLFIHGHEVLIKSAYYPPSYAFSQQIPVLKSLLHDLYDHLKVHLLAAFLKPRLQAKKLQLVFVSDWMKKAFLDCVPLAKTLVDSCSHVIPNTLHPLFWEHHYRPAGEFKADFVTLRPLDNPKYGIDLIWRLAQRYPQFRFMVFGKGAFFQHYPAPPNLQHEARYLSHAEMLEILPHYRCALMPTRLDAQGVMMCEIAAFGMPMITSDLPICHEMLAGFPQVRFMKNQASEVDLEQLLPAFKAEDQAGQQARAQFGPEATFVREVELILQIYAELKNQ